MIATTAAVWRMESINSRDSRPTIAGRIIQTGGAERVARGGEWGADQGLSSTNFQQEAKT